jgi:pSer/pThr/pTyr-binding forkhead associated (FHA) protein
MSISLLIISCDDTIELPVKDGDILFTIGRHRNNTIVLSGRTLSRWHCFLFRRKKNWFIQDGNFFAMSGDHNQWSLNGTFLNGQNLKGIYNLFKLTNQDLITFSTKKIDSLPRLIFMDASDDTNIEGQEEDYSTENHDYEQFDN